MITIYTVGGSTTLEILDDMSLPELSAKFDGECERARQRGMWLFEAAPDFCDYCGERIPRLARLAAGEHRRPKA
ncbi:hypothetical protein [Hydrogenophaga intermedia]|uniref:hypothetical protein n=1 Tax=Hydrogenophaga intermedia TaxID=65786 RepID=UPI0020432D44|nr:hypothetical protein [Hydrogenophaga intermedia]MCM3565939.1 hypothetical protein [Hydrogenophaga intermedia]